MRTIWKYALPVKNRFMMDLPKGAEVLAVQSQGGVGAEELLAAAVGGLQVWALVDSEATETELRVFAVYGTGHELPPDATPDKHIATVQTAGGALVWHIFDIT